MALTSHMTANALALTLSSALLATIYACNKEKKAGNAQLVEGPRSTPDEPAEAAEPKSLVEEPEAPPAPAAAPVVCSKDEISQGFRDARKLDHKGTRDQALAAFTALQDKCFASMTAERKLWLLSDVALLHHKLGDDEQCLETLSSFEPAWVAEAPKPAEAMRHNAVLCGGEDADDEYCDYYTDHTVACGLSLALELAPRHVYRDARNHPCPLALPKDQGDDTDYSAESATRLPGTATRCLAIRRGETVTDADIEMEYTCPKLFLFEERSGTVVGTELSTPEGTMLQRPSDCCHANVLQTLESDKGSLVILHSHGPNRDCFGGTASVDEYEIYRWRSNALELLDNLSVLMH